MKKLLIESPAFEDNGWLPKKYTAFDKDVSPEFRLSVLEKGAVSIAVIMDDLDIPFIKAFNHWCIWNIPAAERLLEGIPHGARVPSLGNAVQGIAYGRNRYRGPHAPFFMRSAHRYVFRFYVLDCFLDLDGGGRRKDLRKAMDGHILQAGSITGKYKR